MQCNQYDLHDLHCNPHNFKAYNYALATVFHRYQPAVPVFYCRCDHNDSAWKTGKRLTRDCVAGVRLTLKVAARDHGLEKHNLDRVDKTLAFDAGHGCHPTALQDSVNSEAGIWEGEG